MNKGKKRLLLLNGSHSEIPLIRAAKSLDYEVITSGNDPALIGHQLADAYCAADYSDEAAILELAGRLDIDAICSCANDFGIITAAYVGEALGLPGHDGHETTLLLHQKDKFKEFAASLNLATPRARCFNSLESALREVRDHMFPIIAKPVDLTGGKGVSRIDNREQYDVALRTAFELSRENRVIVEPFFEGTQHSFSTFLVNQKVVFWFSDNEYSFQNPYFVSTSAAPATGIEDHLQTLIANIETIATELGLVDGVFHVQYLAAGKDVQIIDITRRCSGDMYPVPVSHATGIDWARWIVRAESGLSCAGFPDVQPSGFCGRHCIMSRANGILREVIIDPWLERFIFDRLTWWKPGDRINNYLVDKMGILFLQYESMQEMLDVTAALNDLVQVIVE